MTTSDQPDCMVVIGEFAGSQLLGAGGGGGRTVFAPAGGNKRSLRIVVQNSAEVAEQLDELRQLLARSPSWLVWLATEVLEQLDEPVELRPVDGNGATAVLTGELRVRAQLADKVICVLAAVRAGNGEPGAWIRLEGELHAGPRGG